MSLRVILSSKDITRRDTRTRVIHITTKDRPKAPEIHGAWHGPVRILRPDEEDHLKNGPKRAQERANATDEGEHQGLQPPSPENGSGE